MSRIADVAEMVLDHLNAGGSGAYSMDFTAERRYAPFEQLEDSTLRVLVIPANVTMPNLTRGKSEYSIGVYVVVMKRLEDAIDYDLPAYVDPLIELTEEIESQLTRAQLTDGTTSATCTAVTRDQVYNIEHMTALRQFTSMMLFTLRVIA